MPANIKRGPRLFFRRESYRGLLRRWGLLMPPPNKNLIRYYGAYVSIVLYVCSIAARRFSMWPGILFALRQSRRGASLVKSGNHRRKS